MLEVGIIEPIEGSDSVSPMVVQEKKKKGVIRICIDLWKLNDACVHDPFPTPFIDEVLDNVGRKEAYSFTDGFSGYHQIKITPEDRNKTTFMMESGCFQYTRMPFGLKNVPVIFSHMVIATFKEFIHKLLEVYFDDWIMFGLQGLMVDLENIAVIVNMEAPRNVKHLCRMLGHMGYYRKFIKSYAQITVPMEKLLKKDASFC
eukprot:PITA_03565